MALLGAWANARAKRNEISEVETQIIKAISKRTSPVSVPPTRKVASVDHLQHPPQQPPSPRQQTTGSMKPIRLQSAKVENETSTASRQAIHIDEYKNKLAWSRQQLRIQECQWQAFLQDERHDTGRLSQEDIRREYLSILATTHLSETDPTIESVEPVSLPQSSILIPFHCPDGVTKNSLAQAVDYFKRCCNGVCPAILRVQPFVASMLALQGCTDYQDEHKTVQLEADPGLNQNIIHCIL